MRITPTLQAAQEIYGIARVAQADGTWIVYEPGDTLPDGLFGGPPDPNPVPESVTRRQLYRGLMQVGWLGATKPQIEASIDAMLASMPEPPREIARTEFYTSRDFLRNNALLIGAMKSQPLSKTDAEIDEFFRLCAAFPPEGAP